MLNQSFLIPVFSLFDNKKCKLVPTCNTSRARDGKYKMIFLLLGLVYPMLPASLDFPLFACPLGIL